MMPDLIDDYLQSLLEVIAASPIVRSSNVLLDKRTLHAGLIRGDLYFVNESQLHFRELVEAQETIIRQMYSYHYMKSNGSLIFRYDDTPHHKNIATFPHHKHVEDEVTVVSANPPNLSQILDEIKSTYPLD